MRHTATSDRGRESGFVLVTVAVLMAVLLGFLALGVSTGYLYSARTSAQGIGDAAAIAGAYTYITTPGDPTPGATAEYHATQFALGRADILGVPLTPDDVLAEADEANRRVRVTVSSSQPTFFGRLLGVPTAGIRTVSTAEVGTLADSENCAKPFFIPNNAFRDPISPLCEGCADGDELLVHDYDDGNGYVRTPYADQILANQADIGDPDSFFILKPTNPGQGGQPLSPGQYFLIDFDDSQDNDVADNIAICNVQVTRVECFELHSVQTGVQTGNVAQGLGLIGNGPGLLPDPPDEYDWDAADEKIMVGGDPNLRSNSSPQLVSAPIWDVCDPLISEFCTTGDFPQGTQVALPIVGYAQIFVTGSGGQGGGQGDVWAYLTGVTGCGEIDAEQPQGSSVLSLPLRLIQN